ncbi:Rrf2 family transcriptional regulator [Calothrix sp. 336/3]|uniref:Rrf2 family transcriptional regulator n=1 Tax=Calothrix sp. 336/3 TaxID=1337936 RepID=UPI0004E2CCD5|nr:Rrf2 family transcriptional regulator [Calothrix sp. 336/3]AKG20621.1 Rrf2 family transcriptional regulator [Calothrix sp. 336/3]
MEISNKYEYTLLALLELANCYQKGESLQIRQIAEMQEIPSRYLEQILATLRHGGIIKSIRGAKGGYTLAREPHKITLLEAWYCVEGSVKNVYDLHQGDSSMARQIIEDFWLEASQAAHSVLQKYTLQDLHERQANYTQSSPMYYI